MKAGGSGELLTTHVKFIVEPLSIYKSGAPIISVDGSINIEMRRKNITHNLINAHKIYCIFNECFFSMTDFLCFLKKYLNIQKKMQLNE